ncbi:hypothetical protein PYCC9005_001922 [Savitreella phatthalungensis]
MPVAFLGQPLRRDVLHGAVVYERDALRQGSASSKSRAEVSGSTRKIRRQKGSGAARLGDRTSPMLRGGGRAHGPKPRDFATQLPRKAYLLALRIALSHLYNEGSLTCIGESMELPAHRTQIAFNFLNDHGFAAGKTPLGGRTLFVTAARRLNLNRAISNLGYLCESVVIDELLIHELLKYKRVLIEHKALEQLELSTRIG